MAPDAIGCSWRAVHTDGRDVALLYSKRIELSDGMFFVTGLRRGSGASAIALKVRWGVLWKTAGAEAHIRPSLIPAAPAYAPAAPSTPAHPSVLVRLRGCQLLGG
jgi:hypothetical protein